MKSKGLVSNWITRIVLLCCLAPTVYAWDGHILPTYIAPKDAGIVDQTPSIPAETLDSFLHQESAGLAVLLQHIESWAQESIPLYPPRPNNLAFQANGSNKPIKIRFLEAIRANPFLKLPLFVQYMPGQPHRIHHTPLQKKEVMLANISTSAWIFTPNAALVELHQQLVQVFRAFGSHTRNVVGYGLKSVIK